MVTRRRDAKSETLAREAFLRTLREIGERGSRHPVLDYQSDAELLGYDDMLNESAGDKRC